MVMIHVFHGFLGSPSDFHFLNDKNIISHDLYKNTPQTGNEDILIGYSMGGRLAMELARKNGFQKLILINAHPGLEDDKEREIRSLWEEEVLERLTIPETFLAWWNALPLFTHDRPLVRVPQGSEELFKRMLLSRQENFLPFLTENKDRVHWILGQNDPKYSALAGKLADFNVQLIPGGHRLFQKPENLLPVIRKLIA